MDTFIASFTQRQRNKNTNKIYKNIHKYTILHQTIMHKQLIISVFRKITCSKVERSPLSLPKTDTE